MAVCLLPEILISDYGLPFYFGGTSILIVVSVTMDTVTQIQSHLLAHQYEGLIRKARVEAAGDGGHDGRIRSGRVAWRMAGRTSRTRMRASGAGGWIGDRT